MNYALFHDTTIEDNQIQNNNSNDNQSKNKRPGAPPQSSAKRQRTQDLSQPDDMAVDQSTNTSNNNVQPAFAPSRFVRIIVRTNEFRNRKNDFSKRLNGHFRTTNIQSCALAEVDNIVNKDNNQPFSVEEVVQYLQQLEEDGHFMVADGIVALV